ncbi:MAG: phosphate-starvation-inducible PsiE family protein [Betaproteobacteria bacterium]|jgi:protein PsiE
MKIYDVIVWTEKAILVLIAGFTVYAVGLEMFNIIVVRSVKLTDLLLLFIYAEVLGMVAGFYKNRRIPITIPIFIAMTALCRLIILQGKEVNAINIIYESGAVLLLAIAALVIRWNLIKLQLPTQQSAVDDEDL